MYLQYYFPFYLRVIFHFHDFLVFRVSKVREKLPQEMDEQAREEFFRVKKAHRVAGCQAGDLLPGEIW